MKAFVGSPAGKATIFVYLAGTLLAWPAALSWMVAALFLALAVRRFYEAVGQRESEPAERPVERPLSVKSRPRARAASCDFEPIDVNAVLAAYAAKPGG